MTVNYRLRFRDLLALQLHVYHRNWLVLLVWGMVAATMVRRQAALIAVDTSSAERIARLVFTAVFVLILVWLAFFIIVVLVSLSRRHVNVLADHTVTITEDSLIEDTAHTRCETRWPGVVKVSKTRRRLFVFLGPYQAHVIPRNAFPDTATWQAFAGLCTSRWRAAKAVR